MKRGDASLKGKIKTLAKKSKLMPQELLQMYLFEHLLMRLEKSPYAKTFILKGGLLISSITGVAQRTTMDMDTTVIGLDMDKCSVDEAVSAICSVDVSDGMDYLLERLEPIREEDEYANWRAHLRVIYGKINAPIKVDITTGDEIVPGSVEHCYRLMFEQGEVHVMSYPVETVLAEKLETVIARGIANTRMRDYYDIYTLVNMKTGEIDLRVLREAILATAARRRSLDKIAKFRVVFGEVRESVVMREAWASYVTAAPYAGGLEFDSVVDAAVELTGLLEIE